MNLYAFQPPSGIHGPRSMSVVAPNELQARAAIESHMAKMKAEDPAVFDYDYCDGDLSAYQLTVVGPLSVVENANE